MDQQTYRLLKWAAIIFALFVVGITLYQMAVEHYSGTSGLDFKTGHLRLEDEKYEEALNNFNDALKINQNDQNANFGKALALMGLGKHPQALEYFNVAIAIDLSFAAAFANRGILHDRMGQYDKAIQDYRHALKLDPAMGDGPGMITRFLRAQYEKPPTIADRADYLEQELKKPVGKRLLRVPEIDAKQRAYKVEG